MNNESVIFQFQIHKIPRPCVRSQSLSFRIVACYECTTWKK